MGGWNLYIRARPHPFSLRCWKEAATETTSEQLLSWCTTVERFQWQCTAGPHRDWLRLDGSRHSVHQRPYAGLQQRASFWLNQSLIVASSQQSGRIPSSVPTFCLRPEATFPEHMTVHPGQQRSPVRQSLHRQNALALVSLHVTNFKPRLTCDRSKASTRSSRVAASTSFAVTSRRAASVWSRPGSRPGTQCSGRPAYIQGRKAFRGTYMTPTGYSRKGLLAMWLRAPCALTMGTDSACGLGTPAIYPSTINTCLKWIRWSCTSP